MKTYNNKLFIELPKGVTTVRLEFNKLQGQELSYWSGRNIIATVHWLSDTKDYTLIGTTPLSEEEWKQVVERKDAFWKNYREDHKYYEVYLRTATYSGQSLMEHLGLDLDKKYAVLLKI